MLLHRIKTRYVEWFYQHSYFIHEILIKGERDITNGGACLSPLQQNVSRKSELFLGKEDYDKIML